MFAFLKTQNNVICNIFSTGDFFRKLWGPYAGWAQSVSGSTQYVFMLFCLENCCCLITVCLLTVSGLVLR